MLNTWDMDRENFQQLIKKNSFFSKNVARQKNAANFLAAVDELCQIYGDLAVFHSTLYWIKSLIKNKHNAAGPLDICLREINRITKIHSGDNFRGRKALVFEAAIISHPLVVACMGVLVMAYSLNALTHGVLLLSAFNPVIGLILGLGLLVSGSVLTAHKTKQVYLGTRLFKEKQVEQMAPFIRDLSQEFKSSFSYTFELCRGPS